MKKILIAGASGFVGKYLIESLLEDSDNVIYAISRRDLTSKNTDRLKWIKADLYSLLDIEKALEGIDVAIYLIHSMLPSAKLTQGSFQDFDLILADNFARAGKKNNIKQIIYLSGIIPPDAILSSHLKSRLEVEHTFNQSKLPTTTLRAGVVIGPGGSSYEMLYRLVKRLPIMICPHWTSTISSPISVWDICEAIKLSILNESMFNKFYDVGGSESVSYKEMMKILANKLETKKIMIPVPFVTPRISRLWVSLITGAPRDLVYPLIDSLKTHMVPDPEYKILDSRFKPIGYTEALERTLKSPGNSNPNAFSYTGSTGQNEVRSVQRLNTILRSSVHKVSTAYFEWLPRFLSPFIKVKNEDRGYCFYFFLLKKPLLILKYSKERSNEERELYYIEGGLLAHSEGRPRLEFRNIYGGQYKIAAIHEFKPKLPWFIYKYTQALMHLFVMRAFNKYLVKNKF